MTFLEYYNEIVRCNRCGFCQEACPVFRATGHEAGVARGRLALLRAIIEKRLVWSKEIEEPLFACLLCGACTERCFPAVDTAKLLIVARGEYLDQVDRKRSHQLLFDHLLPFPKRLRLAAKMVAFGKQSGFANVASALGLLRIFGHDFPRSQEIIDHFPGTAFREKIQPGILRERNETLRIGYFVGCGIDIMVPDAAEASASLLRESGETVQVLNNCCCGLPAYTYGDRRAAKSLAKKNLEILAAEDFDLIVTDCSSCASFLKRYPELFPENDIWRDKAETVASRVRDLVEMNLRRDFSPGRRDENIILTYHDPCHASRGQGLVNEPRELLKALPGVEYRELPEADWCCGGAGTYALSHYNLSMKVLDRKMDNVEKTGANLLVTSCPACIIQLDYGIRRRGLPVRVRHISEVLATSRAAAIRV